MTTYIVTLPGGSTNRIVADQAFVEQHYPGAWEAVAAPPAPPAPPAARHITKLAFRNRFSQAEKVAIEIACLDNPAQTLPQRTQAAALRASQLDLQAAGYIDLDRDDTRAGVLQLEQATLLAAGRALQILDAPVQAHEAFKG